MERSTESLLRKLQAIVKVRRRPRCQPLRRRSPACGPLPEAGWSGDQQKPFLLPLQNSDSELGRQVIGEEVERFLREGGGAEVGL